MKDRDFIQNLIWKRLLKKNKFRNICAVLSIILTTVLFTSVFTVLFHYKESMKEAQLEKVGWTAHAAIAQVTPQQYDELKGNKLVEDISYYVHIGFLKDKNLDDVVEVQYCEDEFASWMYYKMSEGHMPQNESEIALSSNVLENLGISYEYGKEISINYNVNGTIIKQNMILSGVYKKKQSQENIAFISKDLAQSYINQIDYSNLNDSAFGYRVVEVYFNNSNNLQNKLDTLISESSCDDSNRYIVNAVYQNENKTSVTMILVVIFCLLIIMVCGYFIIYNIFYISIMQDTKFYGILSTLGFSKKEIIQIVNKQIYLLSLISIPFGLLMGYFVTRCILPNVTSIFHINLQMKNPNPFIFLFSAVISFVTVKISCIKPAKIAASLSPIQAKTFVNIVSKTKGDSKNGYKLYVMAFKNIMRDRKKSGLIIASLLLSVLLATMFLTISKGFNLNKFLKNSLSTDFIIASKGYFADNDDEDHHLNDFINECNQNEGIVYSGGALSELIDIKFNDDTSKKYESMMKKFGSDRQNNKEMLTYMYGLDSYLVNKMTPIEGEINQSLFKSGNYIIVGCFVESMGTESLYKIGDKVDIEFPNHVTKEYEVMAIAELPYDLSKRSQIGGSVDIFLSADEWKNKMQSDNYYMYAYEVEENEQLNWEYFLENSIDNEYSTMSYESKLSYKHQFEQFMYGNIIIGFSITLVISIIGFVNFINMICTNIYSRKKELALLQSLGMQKMQIYKILILEGCYYILIADIVGLLIGLPLMKGLFTLIGNIFDFIDYHFTILPYIVFAVVGLIIALIVSIYTFYRLDKKESFLFRLRAEQN